MRPDEPAIRSGFPAHAESVGEARRQAEAAARRSGVADTSAVALAVSEAVTNAVLHGYRNGDRPGEIEVVLDREPGGDFVVTVTDSGSGLKPRSDSPGLGLGLPLMASVTKRLSVEPVAGGGTQVTMWFETGPD